MNPALVSLCLTLALLFPCRMAQVCVASSDTTEACCAERCPCCADGCDCSADEPPTAPQPTPAQAPASEGSRVPQEFTPDHSVATTWSGSARTPFRPARSAPCRTVSGRLVLLRTGHLLH